MVCLVLEFSDFLEFSEFLEFLELGNGVVSFGIWGIFSIFGIGKWCV